ncbi:hypothetical protein BDV96DRAFT_654212 [Lophiotrema nucula]|uniref:Uncharacterized protein n=1 Tax=Lophiotrema nucula TaxID=690887 RepID=A0A6A5YIS6_9PLEO|nr:hypothetical protein BDV96DRAFT_654212 [Lophiotrema nucula]
MRDNYRLFQNNPVGLDGNDILIMCNFENILKNETIGDQLYFFVEDRVLGPGSPTAVQKYYYNNRDGGLEIETCRAKRDKNLGFTMLIPRTVTVGKLKEDDADLYSQFDKLLVHELSHGHNGGSTEDLTILEKSAWPKWFKFFDSDSKGNLMAYGWKAARYLGENGPSGENLKQTRTQPDGPMTDSSKDTLALFWLVIVIVASKMLVDGLKVLEDGRIRPLTGTQGGYMGDFDEDELTDDEAGLLRMMNTTINGSWADWDALSDKSHVRDSEDSW